MTTSPPVVVPLSPGKRASDRARAWLEDRRTKAQQGAARNQALSQALMGSISSLGKDLGIRAIDIGGERVDLVAPPTPAPSISDRWTKHLAAGGDLVVLEINNAYVGYLGRELVDPETRQLDELIDTDLVSRLAPTAVIYGPGQLSPWATCLPKCGFQLWITDMAELVALWEAMDHWFKMAWHDQVLVGKKHAFKLANVARIRWTRVLVPDLDLRIARASHADAVLEASVESGRQDVAAQADLKRAMSALVSVQDHPVLGTQVEQALEGLLPLLAMSMEGKQRHEAIVKACGKARTAIHKGLGQSTVDFASRPTVFPGV